MATTSTCGGAAASAKSDCWGRVNVAAFVFNFAVVAAGRLRCEHATVLLYRVSHHIIMLLARFVMHDHSSARCLPSNLLCIRSYLPCRTAGTERLCFKAFYSTDRAMVADSTDLILWYFMTFMLGGGHGAGAMEGGCGSAAAGVLPSPCS